MKKKKIKKLEFTKKLMNLEDFYSLEDYAGFYTIETGIKSNVGLFDLLYKNREITPNTVRANFMVGKKEKEILMERNDLKKIFAFIRIYSNEKDFINLLIYRKDIYNTKDILNKINNISFFKGAFKIKLKIQEFPIKNYILVEISKIDKNSDIENFYFFKKFK